VAQTLPIRIQSDGHWLLACAKMWAARSLWAEFWQTQGLVADQLAACPLQVVPVPYLRFESDVENNLIRTTLQTSAAMLAGASEVALSSYFPENSPYTAEGLRLALTQYLVLKHESQLGTTPEPLAGTYALIDLANQLSKAALAQAEALPANLADWPDFLRAGSWQAAIATQAEDRREAFASSAEVWVGGNRYRSSEAMLPTLALSDAGGPDFPRILPLRLA
jgi:methylmalonyl-CoA mutase